jgi:predicted MFS family arabinose efflux permease
VAAVWTYGRVHLVEQGLGVTASTVAWMAIGVGGTVTVATAGRQARLRPARAWLLTSGVVAATIAALGLGAGLLVVAAAVCLLFGWAFVAATSALIAWASVLVPHRAASGTALLFITLTLGQAVGSSVAGLVAEHGGMTAAFLVAAALAGLAAACGRAAPRRSIE